MALRTNLQTGAIWETACQADTFFGGTAPNSSSAATFPTVTTRKEEEASVVRKSITRFLRPNDQYLACASVLFKSRAFHEVYAEALDDPEHDGERRRGEPPEKDKPDDNSIRPVVELPRTQYRKPYIPLPPGDRNRGARGSYVTEEDVFSMSISHQFPFAGLAKVQHDDCCPKSFARRSKEQSPPILVGLDIVVFEPFNNRLYSSEDEFLEVFEDQFTPNEWNTGILGATDSHDATESASSMRLKEFYVRWAMKEAYTKAIGVGMGLPFESFEIHLVDGFSIDGSDSASSSSSIWSRIATTERNSHPKAFRGTIEFTTTHQPTECFYFYFLPLSSNSNHPSENAKDGCACVCVGSFSEPHACDDDNNEWKTALDISWTDLEGLVEWHERPQQK
jgi:4'-phosphopantetheinyl transferase